MNRFFPKTLSSHARNFLTRRPTPIPNPKIATSISPLRFVSSDFRLFSSETDSENRNPRPESAENEPSDRVTDSAVVRRGIDSIQVEDVSSQELQMHINKYFKECDEDVLPTILESILRRRSKGNHEDTDDEIIEQLEVKPADNVPDQDFESDFEATNEMDEEIDDLYDTVSIVKESMTKDANFNMTDQKWNEMINKAVAHGHLKDNKECEEILENMFIWEKLLPDHVKQKMMEKYNEIADMVETGELEPEEGKVLYEEFELNSYMEYVQQMEKDQFDDSGEPDMKMDSDDPPGKGPILRWQSRVVFAPGGEAWHPKNRHVKLSVNVKDLGLSKHQFRRLRELVGKRYDPGRDELTITSERFEHREENRKDCLRTLFSLIEEAGKANKLVEDARTLYVKNRLRANNDFMERLNAKVVERKSSNLLHA